MRLGRATSSTSDVAWKPWNLRTSVSGWTMIPFDLWIFKTQRRCVGIGWARRWKATEDPQISFLEETRVQPSSKLQCRSFLVWERRIHQKSWFGAETWQPTICQFELWHQLRRDEFEDVFRKRTISFFGNCLFLETTMNDGRRCKEKENWRIYGDSKRGYATYWQLEWWNYTIIERYITGSRFKNNHK